MAIQIAFAPAAHPATGTYTLQVMLPTSPLEASGHLEQCTQIARDTGKPVVSACFEAHGSLCMAYVSGDQAVIQGACFLSEAEKRYYQPHGDVKVFNTPMGRLALCVGADCLQPQYARLAALRGCELMVCCLWDNSRPMVFAGPWSVAQANCLGVAVSGSQGGQLILPCTMTPDESGFGSTGFDPEDLRKAYRAFPVFDSLNAAFYRRYREALLC